MRTACGIWVRFCRPFCGTSELESHVNMVSRLTTLQLPHQRRSGRYCRYAPQGLMDALASRRDYHPPAVNGSVAYHTRFQENCLLLVITLELGKTRASFTLDSRIECVQTGHNNTNTASFCGLTLLCTWIMETTCIMGQHFQRGNLRGHGRSVVKLVKS